MARLWCLAVVYGDRLWRTATWCCFGLMLAAVSIGRAPIRFKPGRRRAVGERRRDTFGSERTQSMPTRWRFVTMRVIALLIMIGGVAVVTRLSGSESVDLRGHISVDRKSVV